MCDCVRPVNGRSLGVTRITGARAFARCPRFHPRCPPLGVSSIRTNNRENKRSNNTVVVESVCRFVLFAFASASLCSLLRWSVVCTTFVISNHVGSGIHMNLSFHINVRIRVEFLIILALVFIYVFISVSIVVMIISMSRLRACSSRLRACSSRLRACPSRLRACF